jgi:hypothetical protein
MEHVGQSLKDTMIMSLLKNEEWNTGFLDEMDWRVVGQELQV